jgi:putative redox protein
MQLACSWRRGRFGLFPVPPSLFPMSVQMRGAYLGGLKTEITHGPSGMVIRTAAPLDNQGDGSSFSPTDLVAAGMAACVLTTMAIVAEREGIDLNGVSFSVAKHMRPDPRRIDRIPIRIEMPAGLTAVQRRKLEFTARACPVHRSLLDEIDKSIEFVYPD